MASGTVQGTVIRWDDDRGGAVIKSADLQGTCWAPAAAVIHGTGGGVLRAGQVVDVEWTDAGAEGHPFYAVLVRPRADLQGTVGG